MWSILMSAPENIGIVLTPNKCDMIMTTYNTSVCVFVSSSPMSTQTIVYLKINTKQNINSSTTALTTPTSKHQNKCILLLSFFCSVAFRSHTIDMRIMPFIFAWYKLRYGTLIPLPIFHNPHSPSIYACVYKKKKSKINIISPL